MDTNGTLEDYQLISTHLNSYQSEHVLVVKSDKLILSDLKRTDIISISINGHLSLYSDGISKSEDVNFPLPLGSGDGVEL